MLEAFLARYGLVALFLGAAAEGETAVVIGGMLVHHGELAFLPAVAIAAAGSFLSDQCFFFIGRHFRSRDWVARRTQRPLFQRALRLFERRPSIFVFAFRFLYGLRTVSPVAIGTSNLPASRFVALNAVAALLWAVTFISVGYFCGQGVERLFGRLEGRHHLLLLLACAGALILIFHLGSRFISKRGTAGQADTR